MQTDETPKCELCGEPMPAGETMFKYHGFSGSCPKPPLKRSPTVKSVLVSLPGDVQDFECDAVVVIAVKRRPDGALQPNVVSCAEGFKPKEIAQLCLFAAEDILKQSGEVTLQ